MDIPYMNTMVYRVLYSYIVIYNKPLQASLWTNQHNGSQCHKGFVYVADLIVS